LAISNNKPVLPCKQRRCNTEYHLGCLYKYSPRLFQTKKDDATGDINNSALLAVDDFDDNDYDRANAPTLKIDGATNKDGAKPSSMGPLAIPTGDIYCAKCRSMGAASVLVRYLDKVEYEHLHFACNCAYVTALGKRLICIRVPSAWCR
jgi:hypothetical protein